MKSNNIIISIIAFFLIFILSSFVLSNYKFEEESEIFEYTRTDFSDFYSSTDDENTFIVRYDINDYISENFNYNIILFYNQFTRNENISQSIIEESLRNDVPVNVAFSVAFTESSFNPRAINTSNTNHSRDYGLFQLNNRYHHLPYNEYFNISSNAKMGIEYLKEMIEYSENDIVMAIKAYNAGPTRVLHNGIVPDSTYIYAERILSYEDMLNIEFNKWISNNDR